MAGPHVIVVGGGLSGLSAAHTVLEHGGSVTVYDKNGFFGGNSTKATSGINGALTRTQIDLGIPDNVQTFYDDTVKSARELARPELIKLLTYKSASAVEWLQDSFKLDLSMVSRLGGHSFPRTHRGKEMFPGMVITYALMERLEEMAEKMPERVKIMKKARVVQVITEDGVAVGVAYEVGGKPFKDFGPVVLATGGYAADFQKDGMLEKLRPDLLHLSTTNGGHCTGDGQKMVMALGGNGIDLEKVQVHPTGLVDPKDPKAKVKFLAAEALRGVGGLLLDANGRRFVDELEKRDIVSNTMSKNKFPIRLVLNSGAASEIQWHVKHYEGRGLMKQFNSGVELAKDIGCSEKTLKETFDSYNEIAAGKRKDPFGKQYFSNAPFKMDDVYHVAWMEPVVHYTMGGVEIDDQTRILAGTEKIPLPGLYACGELAGGVHGANRLGGSALLGCVVLGRTSGAGAANYLFQQTLAKSSSLSSPDAVRRLCQISLHIDASRPNRVVVDWGQGVGGSSDTQGPAPSEQTGGQASTAAVQNQATAHTETDPAKVKKPNKAFAVPDKEYTLADVAIHDKPDDCWVVVNGMVLDATPFLEDHPGGAKAIQLYAGRDATEEFNMLHDKNVIRKYAPDIVQGRLKGATVVSE